MALWFLVLVLDASWRVKRIRIEWWSQEVVLTSGDDTDNNNNNNNWRKLYQKLAEQENEKDKGEGGKKGVE